MSTFPLWLSIGLMLLEHFGKPLSVKRPVFVAREGISHCRVLCFPATILDTLKFVHLVLTCSNITFLFYHWNLLFLEKPKLQSNRHHCFNRGWQKTSSFVSSNREVVFFANRLKHCLWTFSSFWAVSGSVMSSEFIIRSKNSLFWVGSITDFFRFWKNLTCCKRKIKFFCTIIISSMVLLIKNISSR